MCGRVSWDMFSLGPCPTPLSALSHASMAVAVAFFEFPQSSPIHCSSLDKQFLPLSLGLGSTAFLLDSSVRTYLNRTSRPYDYNSNSPLPSPSLPGVPSPSPFSPNGSPSSNFQHFSHSADVGSGGLTKQTYSAWVTFPSPDGTIPDPATAYRKKWHMTVKLLFHRPIRRHD